MTPEERSLLERTCAIVTENNEILRKMRRANRFSMAIKIAYWVVIVGISVGAYYFVQKYVDMLAGLYSGDTANIEQVLSSIMPR